MYADDTHLTFASNNTQNINTVLNDDLARVEKWLTANKVSLCYEPEGPLRLALISGFRSMKRLGVFMLPPGWDASPSQGYPQHYAGTHLYTWVERSTVRVKCLA